MLSKHFDIGIDCVGALWERQRNASGARINWMSTTAEAEVKLGGLP